MLSIRGMVEPSVPYEEECFFIAPIGTEGSEQRKRSDGVRDFIVKPAVAELGLKTLRADDLASPGQITLQVIEHVLRAKAVVADLTGANPNVFYELAVRHTAKLPVVLIAEHGEIEHLPFDIQQMRVISLDHQDLASAAAAKEHITRHLEEALGGAVDSPIATVLNLEALEQGTSVERTLAELVTRVDDLSRATTELRQGLRDEQRTLSGAEIRQVERATEEAFISQLKAAGLDCHLSLGTDREWIVLVSTPDADNTVKLAPPATIAEAKALGRSFAERFQGERQVEKRAPVTIDTEREIKESTPGR